MFLVSFLVSYFWRSPLVSSLVSSLLFLEESALPAQLVVQFCQLAQEPVVGPHITVLPHLRVEKHLFIKGK